MNKLLIKTTFLSFVSLIGTLFSTPQTPDIIYISGDKYPLHSELFYHEIDEKCWLNLLYEIGEKGEKNKLNISSMPSGLRRGFRCSWKIEDSKLYLTDFEVRVIKKDDGDYYDIDWYSLGTNDLSIPKFDSSSGRYFFTGSLWVALGDPCDFVRVSPFGNEYKKMMRINLKEGIVIGIDYFYHIDYCDDLVISLGSFASEMIFKTNIGFYKSLLWMDYNIDSVKTSCNGITAVFPSSKFGSDITFNMQVSIIPHCLKGQFQHTIYLEMTDETGKKKLHKILITGEAL